MSKNKKEAPGFSKEQIAECKSFSGMEKDILKALLKDGEMYGMEEAKTMIEDFMKRRIQ